LVPKTRRAAGWTETALLSLECRRQLIVTAARTTARESSMPGELRSPQVLKLSWGRLEVEGLGTFKDAKLYPGGGHEWDWRETGTRHVPGIQPADVAELLDHGAEVVMLSKGVLERLQVCPETLSLLERKGLSAHILPTEAAVRLYNELAATRKVGGLFHSTC
jgi:hypothetical protein